MDSKVSLSVERFITIMRIIAIGERYKSYNNSVDVLSSYLAEFVDDVSMLLSSSQALKLSEVFLGDNDILLSGKYKEGFLSKNKTFVDDFTNHISSKGLVECPCCGAFVIKLTKDHIYHTSKGGINCQANIQLICKKCNSIKSDHLEPKEAVKVVSFLNNIAGHNIRILKNLYHNITNADVHSSLFLYEDVKGKNIIRKDNPIGLVYVDNLYILNRPELS